MKRELGREVDTVVQMPDESSNSTEVLLSYQGIRVHEGSRSSDVHMLGDTWLAWDTKLAPTQRVRGWRAG